MQIRVAGLRERTEEHRLLVRKLSALSTEYGKKDMLLVIPDRANIEYTRMIADAMSIVDNDRIVSRESQAGDHEASWIVRVDYAKNDCYIVHVESHVD